MSAARVLESCPVPDAGEAREYSAMITSHSWLLNRAMVDMLSGDRSLKRARVLDIGTGPGWIPIELARQNPQWEICAVDPSADMLACARQAAQRAGVANRIRFIEGKAEALPFERGGFDIVYSHFMLHHLLHPEKMFDEATRVVRHGGRVLIKDLLRQTPWLMSLLLGFSRHVLRYSPLQMKMYRESLEAALTLDEIRTALKNSQLRAARIQVFRGLDFVIDGR
jgi:ubiquinone/menaquinone biosynthesis C-methylase UbiE